MSTFAITPRQIRAARALVGWSQDDLARAATPPSRIGSSQDDRAHAKPLSRSTIADIENEKTNPSREVMDSICAALEKNRVEFLPQEGVRICHPAITAWSENDAPDANRRLLDDIYFVASRYKLETGTNDILIFGLEDEKDAQDSVGDDYLTAHLERLKEAGLQEKILCGPDAHTFVAPRTSYRRLAQLDPAHNSVCIYGNRVAIVYWRPKAFVITIESEPIASALRSMFKLLWGLHGGVD